MGLEGRRPEKRGISLKNGAQKLVSQYLKEEQVRIKESSQIQPDFPRTTRNCEDSAPQSWKCSDKKGSKCLTHLCSAPVPAYLTHQSSSWPVSFPTFSGPQKGQQKGATSKNLLQMSKVSRQMSSFFDSLRAGQEGPKVAKKCQKQVSTPFNNFRVAPSFRPLGGGGL